MIIIWLVLIEKIQAESDFKNFIVLQNKRAPETETISVKDARSVEECAVRCKQTDGCNKANFISSSCELLRDVNGETVIIDEEDSSFLCKYIFFYIHINMLYSGKHVYVTGHFGPYNFGPYNYP